MASNPASGPGNSPATLFQLFAVEPSGPVSLPLPPGAGALTDLYGEVELGVYSALRTFDHHSFLALDGHLDRTEQSMSLLGWEYELDRERLCRALDAVCRAFPAPEMRVRFDVLAAPATVLGTTSRELIALQSFEPPPPALYETGVRVALADPDLTRENPLAKTAGFAARRPPLAMDAASSERPYEYLLTTADGRILEGSGTNFYGVRDGVLQTAGDGVLEGITRRIILEQGVALGIPVSYEPVAISEIGLLDEAALSGSSRALLPVVQVGDQVIGNGRPGPVSLSLLQAYQRYLRDNIRPAV